MRVRLRRRRRAAAAVAAARRDAPPAHGAAAQQAEEAEVARHSATDALKKKGFSNSSSSNSSWIITPEPTYMSATRRRTRPPAASTARGFANPPPGHARPTGARRASSRGLLLRDRRRRGERELHRGRRESDAGDRDAAERRVARPPRHGADLGSKRGKSGVIQQPGRRPRSQALKHHPGRPTALAGHPRLHGAHVFAPTPSTTQPPHVHPPSTRAAAAPGSGGGAD